MKGRLVMEDKKDFDKDKQETGTQQMPDTPDGNDGDGGKKRTVKLFGHEFDKKKAVMAGLGGLLVLALAGGGIAYAVSQQQPEPDVKPAVEQKDGQESLAVQVGVKADGWVKGESSPVIAHIVNKEKKVDYYHAYDANEQHSLGVPAEGEYEVSFISPVDKDGSIYEVPKASKVKAEVEDKDGKAAKTDLPFEFKPIAADKADADALNAIVKSVGDAVKKGDETLTGANGTKVIELVKENAKANPNADKEKVEEESQKAEDEVTDEPSNGDTGESKPETGGNSSSGGGNGDSAGGGNSGSNGGGESKPQHVHNWVPQTTVVHHEAQVQTVHHDAIYKTVCICNGCNAQFDTDNAWGAHSESQLLAGNYACGSYHPSNIVIQDAWDETVEISPAWDETITTGYVCSGCGAVK